MFLVNTHWTNEDLASQEASDRPSAAYQHDDRTAGPASESIANGSHAPHRKRGRRQQARSPIHCCQTLGTEDTQGDSAIAFGLPLLKASQCGVLHRKTLALVWWLRTNHLSLTHCPQRSGLFSAAAAGIGTVPRASDAAGMDGDEDGDEDGGSGGTEGGRDVVSYDDI